MPEPTTLAVFSLAALALIVVPGPAVIYVVTRGIDQGRRAGLVSALGIEAGGLVHVAAAALGLSALIVSSATAFTVLKYAGAAYLIMLGLRELRGRAARVAPEKPEPAPLRRVFWQGVLVNALNPKTALFFLAFLPQFVDPAAGPVHAQILVLGAVFVAIGFVSDSAWGLAAGTLGPRLRDGVRRRVQRWGSGSVFVALGVGTALSTTRRAV
ncbi:MAG: LysE family translocator [Thermoleophilaceae bacterium]